MPYHSKCTSKWTSFNIRLGFLKSSDCACVINNLLRFSFVRRCCCVLWSRANVSRYYSVETMFFFHADRTHNTLTSTYNHILVTIVENLYAYFSCYMNANNGPYAWIENKHCSWLLLLTKAKPPHNTIYFWERKKEKKQTIIVATNRPLRNWFVLFMNKFILVTFSKFSLDFKVFGILCWMLDF